ncbi:MAG: carbon starvation protein A, partial [bacterium]|nr:carbon starvation protein A [bacterium]
NQLLAGMGFLVVAFYLRRHNKPVLFLAAPLVIMVAMPAWALMLNLGKWYAAQNWLLFTVGAAILCLQAWMVVEGFLMWKRVKGVLPDPLPPLDKAPAVES